ncbi:hypothetical protein E2P81_ATG03795 [Venturia nashicola]|uniref:Chromo domain-containing protein n=1 Tax=Venturia nashicola TaxID=86259 RepID=A0A4Z1PCA8_9PEZI|nr:hypothetical protein E6O75_ATG03881 [Venturia nashicola]TLD38120.1 hypothetical protein E2P81_ATG03795 [Venturia nashicola]
MGRPLGSKNKPRSESEDSHKPKKRVNPVPVEKKEQTAPFVEDLNEQDRFIYVPDTRAARPPVALLPSDSTPQPRRYTILDRIEYPNQIPEYVLREHVDANSSQRESPGFSQSPRTPPLPADLKQTPPRSRSTRSRSASPHISLPALNYDPDDPSLLRISLLSIDLYVSPREVETYENQRFAHPKPEDDPFAHRKSDTSSRCSSSSGRRSVRPQEEVPKKEPIGRPPKKRRLMESVVINNAMGIHSLAASSISGSDQSDGLVIADSLTPTDMDGDVDMMDSIEQANSDSMSESEVDDALRKFLPSKPADSQSRRSSRWSSTRSSMAAPPHPKSLTQRQRISDFAESPSPSPSPSRNTQSRATSYASAQSAIQESRSPSVAVLDHVATKISLQPSPPALLKKVQVPLLGKIPLPRPEKATADSAKQLIREQFGRQSSRSRLKPKSPKRISKPVSSVNQQVFERASTLKPSLKQLKLSFTKATPKAKPPQESKSPPRKPRIPNPPLPVEEERGEAEAEEPEYEVSRILSHHDNEHGRFYRVAWVGFSDEESTYLTEEELSGARKLLKNYKKMLRSAEKGGVEKVA